MTPEERYTENEDLVFWMINRYYPNLTKNEDLMQEGKLALWRACLAYNPEKQTMFSTIAVPYIRNGLSNGYIKIFGRNEEFRRIERTINSLDTPSIVCPDLFLQDCIPGDADVAFFDISGALIKLTDREKKILYMRVLGYTQAEIAKINGVSVGTVNRDLSMIKLVLRSYI